jgi:hypothetical protein
MAVGNIVAFTGFGNIEPLNTLEIDGLSVSCYCVIAPTSAVTERQVLAFVW